MVVTWPLAGQVQANRRLTGSRDALGPMKHSKLRQLQTLELGYLQHQHVVGPLQKSQMSLVACEADCTRDN